MPTRLSDGVLTALSTGLEKIPFGNGAGRTVTNPNNLKTWTLAGGVAVSDGGTGIASYAVGDLLYASGATAISKLADVATGNALLSGGVATAPAWGKITSAHVDSTILTSTTGWVINGTSTFTGAVLIDQTTTGGNTLKFKAASLGVTQVNGKGIWLYNDTAAANGAQQISPSFVLEAQGFQSNTSGSQSVKFAEWVTPIQGAANPSGQWDLYQSINGVAYSSIMTAISSGIVGIGTTTPGLVNSIQFSAAIGTRFHVRNGAAGAIAVIDGNNSAVLLLNDASRAANSRLWGISPQSSNLTFQTYTDATSNTNVWQLDRSGNMSVLGLSYFGALTTPIHTVDVGGSFGAAITSTSTDITLGATHYTVKVDASGANRTITLPAASGVTRRVYIIIKTDATANTVTIDGNASETISGATTKVINTQWSGYAIQCDGSNWLIIATF